MMPIIALICLFVVGFWLLVRIATFLVSLIGRLSQSLGISEFITSFILVGVATSCPELAVGVVAALTGNGILGLGNALGSNLIDLTLIIALPILFFGSISIKDLITPKQILVMGIYALLPVALTLDGGISRFDGLILTGGYVLYLYTLIKSRPVQTPTTTPTHSHRLSLILAFFLTIIALFLASQVIVFAGRSLAELLLMPPFLIGLLIISVGTSLPELVHGLKAVQLHKNQQVVGDIFGSVIVNASLVIGVPALISPITGVNLMELASTVSLTLITLFLYLIGVSSQRVLKRTDALALLAIYLIFIGVEITLARL